MDPAITLLLETLNEEIVRESKKLSGVRDQMTNLRDDLTYFKVILESWTENPIKGEAQKALVKQLREAVYDAEDTLADFVAEETKYRNKSILRRLAHSSDHALISKLLSVAKNIESLKQEVEEIHGRKMKQDGEGSNTCPTHPRPKLVPLVEEEHVVGFDDEARKVIELLTTGPDDLEVITIVGMAGLGKTTLAKMIYRDPKIEFEFYNRVWVYVSQDFNVKKLLIQILGHFKIVTNDMHEMSNGELFEAVYRGLKREKYLIVLDDMWDTYIWDALQRVLPNDRNGSRILITSRLEEVAYHANPRRPPHCLSLLSAQESFKLLNIKALGSVQCPHDLVVVAEHIAEGCHGLPLLIVIIGGILHEKGPEKSLWRDVSNNMKEYINMDPWMRVESLIAWSFYQLPYYLKACFLYFGMFPEDTEISAGRLIRMWIAEGFIRPVVRDKSLENIAEEYLERLVNLNLVMVGELRSNGKIKTCYVHDLIREFCMKMAAKENLYHVVTRIHPSDSYTSPNFDFQNYRRICMHSHVLNFLTSEELPFPRVRSISFSSSEKIYLHSHQVSWILKAFKSLRVLDGKPVTFLQFPRGLAQLVHLNYLVLSIEDKIVPEVIFGLWNLQTLIIYTSSRSLEIKGDTWKTLRLRHLETNASMSWKALSKATKKIEELVTNGNLTTLSTISPETCTGDAFKRVPNINTLGIRGQLAKILNGNDRMCSFDNLMKLESLENLKLINDELDFSFSESKIVRLPTQFPPHVKKLTLTNTQLDWSNMSILGKLVCLEELKLKENAFKGALWEPKEGEFLSLIVLHIGRTDLVYLEASDCHFPSLQRLSLRHCAYLQEFQLDLANISGLQTVELFWTTASVAASIRNIYDEIKDQGKGFKLSIYPRHHDL